MSCTLCVMNNIWPVFYLYIILWYYINILLAYIYIYISKVGLSGIWIHDRWIPFRHPNRLSSQAMSLTHSATQLCTATQFHCWFSVKFHFGYCLHHSARLFSLTFAWGNHMSVAKWMIHMVFTTERFFEITIEGWSEGNLNPRPLNSIQKL